MRESSTLKIIVLSLLVTLSLAITATFIALVASSNVSGTFGIGGERGGIGTVAGGVSGRFVASLIIALPVIFLLVVLLLRRRYR